ncbi:hypothetical protein Tco_0797248 [Tanacetum coccineum]
MENLNFFYQDIGTSSSAGDYLTQEEGKKEALAIRIIQKFALLEEVRPVIETIAYHYKYKKVLDPGAFIFPIRLEGQVNENALADTGSDINTMPYRIYKQLGREEMKKVDRGITMINHTQAEAMGILKNVLCQNDGEINDMLRIKLREAESNEEISTFVAWIRAFNINEPIYAELCIRSYYSTYVFDDSLCRRDIVIAV